MQEATAVLGAIGDEILEGRRSEGNGHWLAAELHARGWTVRAIEVLPDEVAEIEAFLQRWSGACSLIVLSGGLGPTEDDKTRFGIARYLGTELAEDPLYERILERYTGDLRDIISDSRRYQGYIPQNAEAVYNPVGSGLGIKFITQETTVLSFPGVPREFKAMARQELTAFERGDNVSVEICITGWPEGRLAKEIAPLVSADSVKTAFLPSYNLITVVLNGPEEAVRQQRERIERHLEEDCLPRGVSTLEEAILLGCERTGRRLSLAESCTGGMLAARLTSVSGASKAFAGGIVAYSNDVKCSLLGVHWETLERHGAVSEACAAEMARGVCRQCGTEVGLSVTGIAGPTGATPDKPVGTVYVGLCREDRTTCRHRVFAGNRAAVRERSVAFALEQLWRDSKEG
ncbi:MAG: nicotinamide-nucleotide amidohydrolase family protein [Synergistales bacterium]|nr:nicotinamide-nucleotide amidohydrolase family protein [Synergistales bacterium]